MQVTYVRGDTDPRRVTRKAKLGQGEGGERVAENVVHYNRGPERLW